MRQEFDKSVAYPAPTSERWVGSARGPDGGYQLGQVPPLASDGGQNGAKECGERVPLRGTCVPGRDAAGEPGA